MATNKTDSGTPAAAAPKTEARGGKLALGLIFAAALVLALLFSAAATDAAAAARLSQVPVLGDVIRIIPARRYQTAGGNTQAQIDTLRIHGLADAALEQQLNEKFAAYADQLIAGYETDVAAMGAEGHESVTSSLGEVTQTDRILAVQIITDVATGSCTESLRWYNIDKQTGRLLSLADLFAPGADYVTALSDDLRAQMQAALARDANAGYFLKSDNDPGGFDRIAADQQFTIDKNGRLVLVFDEATVAVASMGPVAFTVSPAAVAGIAAAGGPLTA